MASGDQTAALELPIGVTESKVLQQIARIESGLRKTQAQVQQNFVKSNEHIAKSFRPIATEAQGMSRATVASLQNVSYQIQDIFVQIQGGQGAMRAFSQQMPQLLSGFGAAGAAAGLAVAIGSSLIPALIGAGSESQTTKEAVDGLSKALDAYVGYLETATAKTEELKAKYGEFGGVIREMSAYMARVSLADVLDKLQGAIDPIKGNLTEVEALVKNIADQQALVSSLDMGLQPGAWQSANDALILYRDQLTSVLEKLGLTETEAVKIANAINNVGAARASNDMAGLARAAADAASMMESMWGDALEMPPILREVYGSMVRITEQASIAAKVQREYNDLFSQLQIVAADLWAGIPGSGWLAAEIAEAGKLARAFWEAAKAKAAALAQDAGVTGFDDAGNPITNGTSRSNRPRMQGVDSYGNFLAAGESKAGGRKKGGGGRTKTKTDPLERITEDTENLVAQAAAMREAVSAGGDWQRQIEIIEQKQKLLNQAQRDGVKITPEYEAKITAAAAAFVDAKSAMEQMQSETEAGENALENFFGSIIEGSGSAKQALASLLGEIAKAQLSKGLMGLLGATSWGGGLAGTIGSLLGKRAGGGPVRSGVPYLINEQTPNSEVFVPSTSGAVLNVGQAQRALRAAAGGAGGPQITINNNAPGVVVSKEAVTKDEVRIMITQGIARNNRGLADQKYLTGGR